MGNKDGWRKARFNAVDKRRKHHKLEAIQADKINLAREDERTDQVETAASIMLELLPVYDSAKELKETTDSWRKQREFVDKYDTIFFVILFAITGAITLMLAITNFNNNELGQAGLMFVVCVLAWGYDFNCLRKTIQECQNNK